jgi:hypothetical protein
MMAQDAARRMGKRDRIDLVPVPSLGTRCHRNGQHKEDSDNNNTSHECDLANDIPPYGNNEQPQGRHQGWRRSHPRVRGIAVRNQRLNFRLFA